MLTGSAGLRPGTWPSGLENLPGAERYRGGRAYAGRRYIVLAGMSGPAPGIDPPPQRCGATSSSQGRRLGARELQAVCESETGQELSWFLDQWVRSNRFLSYEITSQESAREGEAFVTRPRVERRGDLAMPVPVVARFEDGSTQRHVTDRALQVNELTFTSASRLAELLIDPDEELALLVPLPPHFLEKQLAKSISGLPYQGAEETALDLFGKALESKSLAASLWTRLGMNLFDTQHYPQALQAFERAAAAATAGDSWGFAALVWRGHILDLTGHRDEALRCYRKALEKDTGSGIRHDQYRMTIDRTWVEERLEKPFERR
ncbi:MAG: tetratricopeptide repeat protein [Planctomycetota bacterium]